MLLSHLCGIADGESARCVAIGQDGLLREWPVVDLSVPTMISEGRRNEAGQATTEYAMILVVVAVIAVALLAAGPTGLRKVFGAVIDFIIDKIPN